MIDKPKGRGPSSGRQAGIGAAYFFLRGFAFFFTSAVRSLGGIASIRRASSSRGITGESAAACWADGLCFVMVGV